MSAVPGAERPPPGSLILGAAGLLQGKRAACHWAWRDLLSEFGAILDEGRVVRDGNIFTGGGVTAGIDFALTMVAEIAGEGLRLAALVADCGGDVIGRVAG